MGNFTDPPGAVVRLQVCDKIHLLYPIGYLKPQLNTGTLEGEGMAKKRSSPAKKVLPWVAALIVVGGLAAVLMVGGFAFAASQESHDPFCASCHTQPETSYYGRSTAGQAVDMASFHQPQKVHCIDCHSGKGLTGRISAELLGARNALKWYTGTAVQPAVLKYPIGDANCLKCHQDVTQRGFTAKEQITLPIRMGEEGEEEGHVNHWHEFLARWQTASATAGSCVSCHPGHTTEGTAQAGFMVSATVQNTCDSCHQVLRREGEGG